MERERVRAEREKKDGGESSVIKERNKITSRKGGEVRTVNDSETGTPRQDRVVRRSPFGFVCITSGPPEDHLS